MSKKLHKKLLLISLVLLIIGLFSTTTIYLCEESSVNAKQRSIVPMNNWSYISVTHVNHVNSNPHAGSNDTIRIYASWFEWPWSEGYLIVVFIPMYYVKKIINYYDSPYIEADIGMGYYKFYWYFYPEHGVEDNGYENRPYIELIYLRSGSFTVYAYLLQIGSSHTALPTRRATIVSTWTVK